MTRAETFSPGDGDDIVELVLSRLGESMAILDAIDSGDLLAELPMNPEAASRHQCAVTLLGALRRDLEVISDHLKSAQFVAAALERLAKPAPQD